jgi:hypothetical protein
MPLQTPQIPKPLVETANFLEASVQIPSSIIRGTPTVIDANSLGILITGAGIGQVKRFIAQAAIKGNQAALQAAQIEKSLTNDSIDSIYSNEAKLQGQGVGGPVQIINNPFGTKSPSNLVKPNPDNLVGSYVFDALTLLSTTYTIEEFDARGQLKQGNEITIPSLLLSNAVVSLSISRYIAQTIPIGADVGTIKELISQGEFGIKIQGHLVNPNNPFDYFTDGVNALKEFSRAPVPINVDSEFMRLFGITSIIIEDCEIEQVEGFSGVLTYTISAISDSPIAITDADRQQLNSVQLKNQKIG